MSEMKRPYDIKKVNDLAYMESDNHPQDPDVWSILHSGEYVSLHSPSGGGWVQIPRDQFNRLVDWYMKPQPHARKKRAALAPRAA